MMDCHDQGMVSTLRNVAIGDLDREGAVCILGKESLRPLGELSQQPGCVGNRHTKLCKFVMFWEVLEGST